MTRCSAAAFLVLVVGCSPGRAPAFYTVIDASLELDAGSQLDASSPDDAGAQVDASTPVPDGGNDAGLEMDAGQDAGPIACSSIFDCPVTDAGVNWNCVRGWCVDDNATDAGEQDAGVVDAGLDLDAGPKLADAGYPNCDTLNPAAAPMIDIVCNYFPSVAACEAGLPATSCTSGCTALCLFGQGPSGSGGWPGPGSVCCH